MENLTPLDLPAPEDRMARVHTLAYDLAYGVIYKLWPNAFHIRSNNILDVPSNQRNFYSYLLKKWSNSGEERQPDYLDSSSLYEYLGTLDIPQGDLLLTFRYLEEREGVSNYRFRLTEKAFTLLENVSSSSVFISYNRTQSSAVALLILNVFETQGLNTFLDIRSIAPGDDWHGLIEKEVKNRENFIVLLNRTTLKSKYVRQEIRWAIEADSSKRIIPIFHGGLKPKNFKDDEFQELLAKNAIVVEQETAIAYESALLQLLNYFGRTP